MIIIIVILYNNNNNTRVQLCVYKVKRRTSIFARASNLGGGGEFGRAAVCRSFVSPSLLDRLVHYVIICYCVGVMLFDSSISVIILALFGVLPGS